MEFYEDEREGEEGYDLTYFFCRTIFRERLVEKYKKENKGKYVWFHAMHGVDKALYWGDIASSYEEAVEELAAQEGVDKEDIINDYDNIYYIIDIDEISDEDLLECLDN